MTSAIMQGELYIPYHHRRRSGRRGRQLGICLRSRRLSVPAGAVTTWMERLHWPSPESGTASRAEIIRRGKNQEAVLTAILQKAMSPAILTSANQILGEVQQLCRDQYDPGRDGEVYQHAA